MGKYLGLECPGSNFKLAVVDNSIRPGLISIDASGREGTVLKQIATRIALSVTDLAE